VRVADVVHHFLLAVLQQESSLSVQYTCQSPMARNAIECPTSHSSESRYFRDKKCCCLCRAARHVKSHRFARLIELHELLDCASELMIPSLKHQKRKLKVKQRQAVFAVLIEHAEP
jgi:hypothetical protein